METNAHGHANDRRLCVAAIIVSPAATVPPASEAECLSCGASAANQTERRDANALDSDPRRFLTQPW
jgi:hypothetical protein